MYAVHVHRVKTRVRPADTAGRNRIHVDRINPVDMSVTYFNIFYCVLTLFNFVSLFIIFKFMYHKSYES